MTGPEHYREAERAYSGCNLQAAQVHATLALAAATVLPILSADTREDWREVLS